MSPNNNIPGFPGYRNRENRSGLDYLDTRSEAAHMEGLFYRKLYTLQLRTRNPFYLVLMFLFGLIPFLASVGLAIATFSESRAWVVLIFPSLITVPLTINFVLSLSEIFHITQPIEQNHYPDKDKPKKKFPRRRKDYK